MERYESRFGSESTSRYRKNVAESDFDLDDAMSLRDSPKSNVKTTAFDEKFRFESLNLNDGNHELNKEDFLRGIRRNEEILGEKTLEKKKDSLESIFGSPDTLSDQVKKINFTPQQINLDQEVFVDAEEFLRRNDFQPNSPSEQHNVSIFSALPKEDTSIAPPGDFFAERSRNLKVINFDSSPKKVETNTVSRPNPEANDTKVEGKKWDFHQEKTSDFNHVSENNVKPIDLIHSSKYDTAPRSHEIRTENSNLFSSYHTSLHGSRVDARPNVQEQPSKPSFKLDLSISQDTSSLQPSHDGDKGHHLVERKTQSVFEKRIVDYSGVPDLRESIQVNLDGDPNKVVADTIQTVKSIPSSSRADFQWTGPIHPSHVVHRSLDAVVAVQAMVDATNVLQASMAEVFRLRTLAQEAVKVAVVTEAIAIADYEKEKDGIQLQEPVQTRNIPLLQYQNESKEGMRGQSTRFNPTESTQSVRAVSERNIARESGIPSQAGETSDKVRSQKTFGDASPIHPSKEWTRYQPAASGGVEKDTQTTRVGLEQPSRDLPSRHREDVSSQRGLKPPQHLHATGNGKSPESITQTHESRNEAKRTVYGTTNSNVPVAHQDRSFVQSNITPTQRRGSQKEPVINTRQSTHMPGTRATQPRNDLNHDASTYQINNARRPLGLSPINTAPVPSSKMTPTESMNIHHEVKHQSHLSGRIEESLERSVSDVERYITSKSRSSSPTRRLSATMSPAHGGVVSSRAGNDRTKSIQQTETPLFRKSTRGQYNTVEDPQALAYREARQSLSATPYTKALDRPKLCKRFLCTIGGEISETFVFRNTSSNYARICASIEPLSRGCNQFSIIPTVLEMPPNASDHFVIRFVATQIGAVSGIFQFRSMSGDPHATPYEIIVDAHVKQKVEKVSSQLLNLIDIHPTYLRLPQNETGTFEISNISTGDAKFSIHCPYNHVSVEPQNGVIMPKSKMTVNVVACDNPPNDMLNDRSWCGSFTVTVNGTFAREISIVIDRSTLERNPSLREVALSSSASTTTSTRSKSSKRKRGLFFQAQTVDFGTCKINTSQCIPIRVCNGAKESLTFFLQQLPKPFSCTYSSLTLRPRSYVEVPVIFTPETPDNFSALMTVYSVSDKVSLTLTGQGIN